MELSDLKKIGLTHGEISVYSALLDLGESTRTALAKTSGISPSKIYDVANRLLENGLISSVKKNGTLHFSAASPEKITTYLQKKEQDLENEKNVATQMLPILLAKYQKTKDETDIEVFYGWDGMTTAFNDLLGTLHKGDENYVFGASQGVNSEQANIFFSSYFLKKRKQGFTTKIIFNEDVKENDDRIAIFKEKPNEIRFLHQQTFTEINLYHNTVLIVMLLKKPVVIRINNQESADSFKKFFDSMWHLARQ
jgi:sugar-specific transcriptional regulator TrmB